MEHKFRDVEVERSGKTHYLREYELGLTFANKVKYVLEVGPFEDNDIVMADIFGASAEDVNNWASGKKVPDDRNIITVINKYYRFLYERNNGGLQ